MAVGAGVAVASGSAVGSAVGVGTMGTAGDGSGDRTRVLTTDPDDSGPHADNKSAANRDTAHITFIGDDATPAFSQFSQFSQFSLSISYRAIESDGGIQNLVHHRMVRERRLVQLDAQPGTFWNDQVAVD